MTIIKTVTAPNGAVLEQHNLARLEVEGDFSISLLYLNGCTAAQSTQPHPRPFAWQWRESVVTSALPSLALPAIERWLVEQPDSPFYGGSVVENETPLQLARLVKWSQIKAARASSEYAGFMFKGHLFDSDEYSQGNIQGAVLQAILEDDSFTRDWTLVDNTTMTLTKAEVIGLGVALGAHIDSVHSRGRALRALIEAPDATVETVEAITWDSATFNPPHP